MNNLSSYQIFVHHANDHVVFLQSSKGNLIAKSIQINGQGQINEVCLPLEDFQLPSPLQYVTVEGHYLQLKIPLNKSIQSKVFELQSPIPNPEELAGELQCKSCEFRLANWRPSNHPPSGGSNE